MSAARTVLTMAAAIVVVPLAMRAREGASAARMAIPASAVIPQDDRLADPALVRAYLQAVRGSNAVVCEILISGLNSWSSNRAPDRDSVAWKVSRVVQERIGAPESVRDLVTAMKSDDACVSRVAARLLGRTQVPAAKAELLAALSDASPTVRRLGAIGLGFSEDTTATPPLVRALADRDATVRAAAAWALGAVQH